MENHKVAQMRAQAASETENPTRELLVEEGVHRVRLGLVRICGASARDCRIQTANRGPGGRSRRREGVGYWGSRRGGMGNLVEIRWASAASGEEDRSTGRRGRESCESGARLTRERRVRIGLFPPSLAVCFFWPCLVSKNFVKFFRFPVTSNL